MSIIKKTLIKGQDDIIFKLLPSPYCMSYPVGEQIMENMSLIKSLIVAFKELNEYQNKYVNFICMGSSGAIIGAIFAMEVPNSKIIHIKKHGERSHSDGDKVKLFEKNAINVIVDDIIESGSTMNKMYAKLLTDIPHISIDVICISGSSCYERLDFAPKYFICGRK